MTKPGRVPIKSWVGEPDAKTLEQATNLSNLPFAIRHVAHMPDAHPPYGMPIGGVLFAEEDQGQLALAAGKRIRGASAIPMSVPSEPAAEPIATVPLYAAIAGHIDLEAAQIAFAEPSWLGRLVDGPPGEPRVRRVAADLELPIRDGSAPGPIRKSALIDLGEPRLQGNGLALAIAWQSATFAPLFPVFSGELRVSPGGIALAGRYVPPLGRLGLVIDAALLHFIARRSAQALLASIAARISS